MNCEPRTFFYKACGLTIGSTLALPELAGSTVASLDDNGTGDVVVEIGKTPAWPDGLDGAARFMHATPEGVFMGWRSVGTFLVRNGREIIIDPAPNVEERMLRLIVLGTALAILVQQRGQNAVLHASAIAISRQAVAFVGEKFAGKSTIAATLHKRGHHLVADDVLVVELGESNALVVPGFPHIKLWPDSVTSLGYVPETLPQLHPAFEKRGYRVSHGFSSEPTPLTCVYVLGQGPEPCIEALRPKEAMIALLPHWYGARFGAELLEALGLSTHFRQCADLVSRVSVFKLKRPPSLSALPDVARLVESHFDSVLDRAAA